MNIVKYPHPALRHPCKPLAAIDKKLHLHIGQMFELLYAAKGLGLAAPQVALPFQFFIINPTADPEKKDQEGVYINPVIVTRKGTIEDDEGCLSFPGLYQKVRRAKSVKVRAYNLKGEAVEVDASNLVARLLQHETDHLHGDLYIDKMSMLGKRASEGFLAEFERDYRRKQERGELPSDADINKGLDAMEGLP